MTREQSTHHVATVRLIVSSTLNHYSLGMAYNLIISDYYTLNIYIKQASTLRSFATVALNLGDNYGICYITRYIVRCITRYVILPDMLYNRILG